MNHRIVGIKGEGNSYFAFEGTMNDKKIPCNKIEHIVVGGYFDKDFQPVTYQMIADDLGINVENLCQIMME